jgi:tetratricopeptide (TPR) repeat protein/class 3 adenylate cyclase
LELVFLLIAVVGLIFAYFELVVPFVKGEVKFSKKFPFITSTKSGPAPESPKKREGVKEKHEEVCTVMFTDIKGYTDLKLKDESQAHELLEEYKQIVQPVFSKYKGVELKIKDDEFYVQFTDPLEATSCAVEIQNIVNDRNVSQPPERQLAVRVGIHAGPVAKRKKEVCGDGIETASLIGPLAEPGMIYITEGIYQRIRNKIEIPIHKLTGSELNKTQVSTGVYKVNLLRKKPGFQVTEEKDLGRIKIAVVDFINETDEKELNGLSGMLITALEQSRHLSVLTRPGMLDVLKQMGNEDVERIDEVLGREIGRKAQLNALAIASVRKFGEIYATDVKVLDPQRDEYLFTASAEGRGQECIPAVIDTISKKTRVGLEEKLSEIQSTSQKVSDITTVSLEAYQHYFHGEELINKLEFKKARKELKKAIELDDTFGLAYYSLAYAIGWERDRLGAREYIKKAMSLIERIPEKERYLVRATNAIEEEGFEAGIAVLRDMEKVYPHDKEMMYNIGDWSFHVEQYTTAIEYLGKVLAMDPTHDRSLEHMTWTYREMGQFDKMLEYAQRFEAATHSDESYELLALAYSLQGDFDAGLETLRRFLELFPSRYSIRGLLADLYAYKGQFDRALNEIKTLTEAHQPPEAQFVGQKKRARFLPYVGKYRETLAAFDRVIDHYVQTNDMAEVNYYRVVEALRIAYGWHDIENAWEEVEKTFAFRDEISPHRRYYGALSFMCVLHGDYVLAESTAEKVGTVWWRSFIMSLIHARKGECAKAESLAGKVLKDVRTDVTNPLLYSLAECQFESGQLDKAEKSLFQLQQVFDDQFGFRAVFYPKSYHLLGKIYEKQNDRKRAIQNYEKFLDIWKDADEDLPDLIDAKRRLSALRQSA